MNRAIAAVYAISIGSGTGPDGEKYTLEERRKLIDQIPALISEISRLDAIANDPFVRGYLEARKQWCSHSANSHKECPND